MRGVRCMDCALDVHKADERYMVADALWLSAVGSYTGHLCVLCLERRIHRRLRPDDFKAVPLNTLGGFWLHSDRLRSRLAA